jgi:coniferyl-aldehyde dehydrogenase
MSLVAPLPVAADAAPDLARILTRQREAFLRAGPPEYRLRVLALDKLQRMIVKFRDDIAKAISEDFGNRSPHETLLAEVLTSLDTVRHARKHSQR